MKISEGGNVIITASDHPAVVEEALLNSPAIWDQMFADRFGAIMAKYWTVKTERAANLLWAPDISEIYNPTNDASGADWETNLLIGIEPLELALAGLGAQVLDAAEAVRQDEVVNAIDELLIKIDGLRDQAYDPSKLGKLRYLQQNN